MDFVAIDFETANESPLSACELGFALVRNYEVVETHSWLIRPVELRFNPYNTKIHGISAADVAEKPKFDFLWVEEIRKYIEGELVIAHNADFDLGVLKNLLHHYHLTYKNIEYACSIKLAKRAFDGYYSYGLKNLSKELGINLNHHRAESDAHACAIIASKAFRTYNISFAHELGPLMNITSSTLKATEKPFVKRKLGRRRFVKPS
jgi:DNA polymerase III subunit epsilon